MLFKRRQSLPNAFGKTACCNGQSPSSQLKQVDVGAGNIFVGNDRPCESVLRQLCWNVNINLKADRVTI